jgi:peptide/nickel transport system substrate-binding protein
MESSQSGPVPPPAGPEIPGGMDPRMKILVVVVAVLLIAGVVTVAYALTRPPLTVCSLSSTNPLIFDQPETPDTLDPHHTFSTPGWGIVQQVYQSLVNYNGTSTTKFLPWLATNWTVSPSGYNYTFTLRQNVHFSNGHPFNAYVMWYSLYRALTMLGDGSFILQQMFWFPGLNYDADANDTANATAWMLENLNTFDFSTPTPSQLAIMTAENNSFQVIDQYKIQLNMGHGYLGPVAYSALLPAIAGPIASAVDPIVIGANGGVVQDKNPYMAANMIGTGPYLLKSYDISTGYLLEPDPNYWARTVAAAEPWNNILQPAKASIQVNFQGSETVAVQDIKRGSVAGLSFAYVGAAQVNSLAAAPCVKVDELDDVYSSTAGAWWIFMNQQVEPFNDIHVRRAVAHAINYNEIIQRAFNGYGKRWVGPVPLGYEHYNPNNLNPYEYNLTKAMAEMNQSAWRLPGGYPTPINYMYIKLGAWEQVALLIEQYLAKIKIDITPVGLNNLDDLYTEQGTDSNGVCLTETPFNNGPFPIGQEFYTSDYISPDDWTQNNAISDGSANVCMARYANDTVDGLVLDAAGETNPAVLDQYYGEITQAMYDNYTVAWLVVPTQFQVAHKQLTGYVTNAMGAALPFVVVQNTMVAGPPVSISAAPVEPMVARRPE